MSLIQPSKFINFAIFFLMKEHKEHAKVEKGIVDQTEIEKDFEVGAAFEMANVSMADTGLPYDLWIDSVGKDRSKHHEPIIKVYFDGKMIPITISETPDISESVKKQGVRDFPHFEKIKEYIRAYYKVFLAHYNKILTDKETLIFLSTVDEASRANMEIKNKK